MRRSLGLIVTLMLAAIWYLLGWRLGLAGIGRALFFLPFAFVWLMPAYFWQQDEEKMSMTSAIFHWAAFLSMGYLSFLGVTVIVRDLTLFWCQAAYGPLATQVVLEIAGGALLFGIFQALRGPVVREVVIPFDHLRPSLAGLKIAQISDLHIGLTVRKNYVEDVVEKVRRLEPDLVVITGDLADGVPSQLSSQTASLARMAPPGRLFYILGNHECYWDGDAWIKEMERLGATVLLNSSVELRLPERNAVVWISGVTDPAYRIKPDVVLAGGAVPKNSPELKILLAHQPQIADRAEKEGFDLELSGHTHGGQFFPWTLIAKWVYGERTLGLSRVGRMWLYVSAGTGSWGPPVRLGTRPEISLLKIGKNAVIKI